MQVLKEKLPVSRTAKVEATVEVEVQSTESWASPQQQANSASGSSEYFHDVDTALARAAPGRRQEGLDAVAGHYLLVELHAVSGAAAEKPMITGQPSSQALQISGSAGRRPTECQKVFFIALKVSDVSLNTS